MRKIYFILCVFFCQYVFSQNNVGIGIATPDPSAILDLTSTGQGFLVPRMSSANRIQIVTPATGLIVYDLDSACTFFYTGTRWQNLCVSGGGYNDSIYFNTIGTVSILDGGGTHTSPQAAWLTTGNTGTNPANNYAGTADAQNFILSANGTQVMRLTVDTGVDIGNPPAEDPNAILNINSNSKGVLFPNLTSAQRDAIQAPTAGLTIYNNTLSVHQFWNGTCWVNVGQSVCSFTYSLAESHTTDCLFKSSFSSVSDTLTINLVSGTASPVILSAAGVPAGVLVNFSNNYLTPTQTSVMTMTSLPTAPDGTYNITILATSGSTVDTLTYTLTIYDFAVTLTPDSSTISLATAQAGGVVATATLAVGNPTACSASAGNAELAVTVNPPGQGVTASLGSTSIPVPGSTTLSIYSTCGLQGTYQITVTSTVGVSVSTSVYTLTINGPAPILISSNMANINLYILAGSPSCAVLDTFIVEATDTVYSNSTAQNAAGAAIQTGSFVAGSKIVLVNNGAIIGAGGAGGNGSGYGGTVLGGSCSQLNGLPGGNAIWVTTPVVIDNLGLIASGGGGGGAGEALGTTECTLDVRAGSGGGGGQGYQGGAGGSNGGGSYPANAGSPGTPQALGAGGAVLTIPVCTQLGFSFGPFYNGTGGNGGALGAVGSPGNTTNSAILGNEGVCGTGTGGAAGFSIVWNGNTQTFTGAAVIGPQSP